MTLASTVQWDTADGDGVTVTYPIGFRYFSTADIHVAVLRDGAPIEWSYTVAAPGEGGGSFTLVGAPLVGDVIVFWSDAPPLQPTSYVGRPSFPYELHELALDRLTAQMRDLRAQVERSIRAPMWQAATDALPRTPLRLLGFDANGDLTLYVPNDGGSTTVTPEGGSPASLAELLAGLAPLSGLNVRASGSLVTSFYGETGSPDMNAWEWRNQDDGTLLGRLKSDDGTAAQAFFVLTRRADFTLGDPGDPDYPNDRARLQSTGPDGATSSARATGRLAFPVDALWLAEKQGTATNMVTPRGVGWWQGIEVDWRWNLGGGMRALWDGALTFFSRLDAVAPLWFSLAFGLHEGVFGLDRGGRFGLGTRTPFRKFHARDSFDETVARFEAPNDTTCRAEFKDSGTVTPPSVGSDGDDMIISCGGGVVLRVTDEGVSINGGAVLKRLRRVPAVVDFPSIPAHSSQPVTVTVPGAQVGDDASACAALGSSVLMLRAERVTVAGQVTVRCYNISAGAVDPAAVEITVETRGY